MAFQRKIWKDRLVETPNRRKLIDIETEEEKVYDISREEGEVFEIGDKFDEANMNNLELRIKEGFDTLADVARTGDYNDLENTPAALPAAGGEADSIKGLGNADAIKGLIQSAGGDSYQQSPYEEGNDPYFITPFNKRSKPKNQEDYSKLEEISYKKYSDEVGNNDITASITFKDDGIELFNVKIQPTKTTIYNNTKNMGFVTEFEDGSTIMGKPIIDGSTFRGIEFSNGKQWIIAFGQGDFPGF